MKYMTKNVLYIISLLIILHIHIYYYIIIVNVYNLYMHDN